MKDSPLFRTAPHASLVLARRALLRGALGLGLAELADATARAEAPAEDFVVIVNRENQATSVSRSFLLDVFLKRVSRWDDGALAAPVDQAASSPVRRSFSETVLNRSVTAVRNYWQQRIFSGRDIPPPELESDDAVIRFVARYRGAVGYVSAAAKLNDSKSIVLR